MNIDKIIEIVHKLKEDTVVGGMTTGSSGPIAGYSEKSPAEGSSAGITPKLGKMQRRNKYATGGYKSRSPWLKYLKGK
jgi:hypothetical protein